MKQSLQIMADFDKPELLKDMVEKLVTRRTKPVLQQQNAVETSSTEAYVCGTVSINEYENTTRVHFDSSFLFTCIRGADNEFDITWSVSMS